MLINKNKNKSPLSHNIDPIIDPINQQSNTINHMKIMIFQHGDLRNLQEKYMTKMKK
jgi:hypothetical protein